MRTTITLTSEAQALGKRTVREWGASCKEVVHEAIAAALLQSVAGAPVVMPTVHRSRRVTGTRLPGVEGESPAA